MHLNKVQDIEQLSSFNHIEASLELNNNGDLAFLSLNLGTSPVEERILPRLTPNEKNNLGLHRLIKTPPLLHVHVGEDVCSMTMFCSSIELESTQFDGFDRGLSSKHEKKSVNFTWTIESQQDFTWKQGRGAFVIIKITSGDVSRVVWLLRLNCSDPDTLSQDMADFGLGVHRLYKIPGVICPQEFQNSVERTIPFVVGTEWPKVNGGKGYGSDYRQVSTINRVFVAEVEYKLFIATKLYTSHRASWKIEDDLTIRIVQMVFGESTYPKDVEVTVRYTLDLQNGWSVSWKTKIGMYNYFQKNVSFEMIDGSLPEIIGKIDGDVYLYSDLRQNGISPDILKEFGFITDIPNRLLLPFQEELVSFLEVEPGEWAKARDGLSMDRYVTDASLKFDPSSLLSQDAETTPSVLFETPSEEKQAALDVNDSKHLEWLQNLFKERWVVYPKCGRDDSEIVAFENVAHIFVRIDIRRQGLYLSDYEVVQELRVRRVNQHHYPNNKPLSLDQLKESDPTFTDIFQRARCEISILQHREQTKRIAIIYITGYAQEWLNRCFLNDVRPFAACLPRHGFDGDREKGDFFSESFANQFAMRTKYIITNIDVSKSAFWNDWAIYGGYVAGGGGVHKVSRRLWVHKSYEANDSEEPNIQQNDSKQSKGNKDTDGRNKNRSSEDVEQSNENRDQVMQVKLQSIQQMGLQIGVYVITQEEWFEIMGTKPWDSFQQSFSQLPATGVTWRQSVIFCNLLSKQQGLQPVYKILDGTNVEVDKTQNGYRLLTKKEWEEAALANQKTKYAGGNSVNTVGWYKTNAFTPGGWLGLHPVGQKAANGFGLYDMSGNTWEWCEDSSVLPGRKIVKGGGYRSQKDELRVITPNSMSYAADFNEMTANMQDQVAFRICRKM